MIITQEKTDIISSGAVREKDFEIKASAKAFYLISQTLYKDPILAIVRELAANAWDAHQKQEGFEGTTDTPFDVHLPSQLEPWFSIRDYGIGMSPATMFDVYTTVFESTKEDSNDGIGCMGLGSKTPFAYNNGQAFSVTSIHKGMRAVYTAYLKDGTPRLTQMTEEEPTDEPDGLEVNVPINQKDYHLFETAARRCIGRFNNPTANVVGYDIPVDEVIQDADKYYLAITRGVHHTIAVNMGNIVYPVNRNDVDSELWSEASNLPARGNIILKADIGDVNIAASREELHYDERTREHLNSCLEAFITDFVADTQARFDEFCKTATTRREVYQWVKSEARNCEDRLDVNWRDEPMSWADWVVQAKTFEMFVPGEGYKKVKPYGYLSGIIYEHTWNGVRRNTMKKYGHRTVDDWASLSSHKVSNTRKVWFFEDDATRGVEVARRIAERDDCAFVVYYHKDKTTSHEAYNVFNLWLEAPEKVHVKCSEVKDDYIEKKAPADRKANRQKPVPVFEFEVDGSGYKFESEMQKEELETGEYYYAVLRRDDIVRRDDTHKALTGGDWGSSYGSVRDGLSVINHLAKCMGVKKVIILRVAQLGRAERNPNAKCITDPENFEIGFTDDIIHRAFEDKLGSYSNRWKRQKWLQKELGVNIPDAVNETSFAVYNFYRDQKDYLARIDEIVNREDAKFNALHKTRFWRNLFEDAGDCESDLKRTLNLYKLEKANGRAYC